MRISHFMAAACCATILSLASPAMAQDVTLRIADSLPVGHYVAEQGIKLWMKEMEERTGGKLKAEYYPASQLGQGKDLMALTQSGVTDIALIQAAYISEKLPLSGVVELPELFPTSCAGTHRYFDVASEGGILYENELKPNGMHLLFGAALAPYQLLMKTIPVETISQLQGAKIRTGGGTQDLLVNKLGAVPVRIPGPEMYESLSRGTADGVILPFGSVFSYDLQGLLGYTTLSHGFGTTVTAYMISDKRWNELSPEQQKVLEEAGKEASDNLCAYIDAETEELVGKLKEAGIKVIDLKSEEQKKMSDILSSVADEWAATLDRRGLPATELLKAMRAQAAN